MDRNFVRFRTRALQSGLAGALVVAMAPVLADVTKWNVTAAATGSPKQTVVGYFTYDTAASNILDWTLTETGFPPTPSVPVTPSYVLQPCGGLCLGLVGPSIDPQVAGAELDFFDFSSANADYLVELALPRKVDLTGLTTKSYTLVSGQYPYSFAIVASITTSDQTDINLSGTIRFGGEVLTNFQGGTAKNPVSLRGVTRRNIGIGQINAQIGPDFGTADFYRFFAKGGSHWSATARLTGGDPAASYVFELLGAGGRVLQTVNLNASNNFEAALVAPQLDDGYVVMGASGTAASDAALSITFANAVYGSEPDN